MKINSINKKTKEIFRHKTKESAINFVNMKGKESEHFKIYRVDLLGRKKVEILPDGREVSLKK